MPIIKDLQFVSPDRNLGIWKAIGTISKTASEEEAFYVCNVDEIKKRHDLWKSYLPHVTPHYAVKCNDDLMVLNVLAALGNGFDCASKVEIQKVLSTGVNPDRIIFANPTKSLGHIRYAASVGVTTMTFDNECELYKIRNVCPQAKLVLRIRSDAKNVQYNLGKKFGCDATTEAPHLLRIAKNLNLNVVGVCFHVGSGCREPLAYYRAISAARDVFDHAKSLGYRPTLLDIGGGYPGVGQFDEFGAVIKAALSDFFADVPNVSFISEPGRFFVTTAYTLICNIHSIRNVWQDGKETHRMYYINDGVYGSFNCVLTDEPVPAPVPLGSFGKTETVSSSIWGPTCDGLDRVTENVQLPKLTVGDWLVFENMGAYTLTIGTRFNGFTMPYINYVITRKLWCALQESIELSGTNLIIEEED